MKILYGITKPNFGGAQRYVFDLATRAKGSNHEVKVVCGKSGPLTDKLAREGVEIISLEEMSRDISLGEDIASFLDLLKILKSHKPDVFHTNSSKMGGLGALAGRLTGIRKIVFTAHGWAFNEPRPFWQKMIIKFLYWIIILLSHRTICVSAKTMQDVSSWPFIKNRLVLIRNGVEETSLLSREQARRALGIHDETLIVGTVSELHRIKGIDILLRAWGKFSKHHQAELIIIGEGEEREELEALRDKLDTTDSVTFRGYLDNVRTYLPAFDIFCLPSRSEAMPYSVLEAGLAGLPVIATSVGGIPEVIESGVSGVLTPPENPELIFSALALFHDNPRMRDRLGTKLKETVSRNFTVEEMVRETFRIYY